MWGMALLSTSVIFLAPLIYISNKELIDGHLEHASNVAASQAAQVRDIAGAHAGRGFEAVKGYTGDVTNKAGEFVGQARQKIPIPAAKQGVNEGDFPRAPNSELPSQPIKTEQEPVLSS